MSALPDLQRGPDREPARPLLGVVASPPELAAGAESSHGGLLSDFGSPERRLHRVILPRQLARCLRFIAEHPGASNAKVQRALGIRHPSQASRALSRLAAGGLTYTERSGRAPNAWQLTDQGHTVLAGLPGALYE